MDDSLLVLSQDGGPQGVETGNEGWSRHGFNVDRSALAECGTAFS